MKKLTTEEFKERLRLAHNDEFELIGEYTRNSDKVKLLHKKCGNIIEKIASKMIMKNPEYCYICNGKNGWKTTDTFKTEVFEKFSDKYTILGEYKKAREHILVENNECGHVYEVTPDNLLRGKGCPRCGRRNSQYTRAVEAYLIDNSIEYEREKRYEDCKHIRCLPFDFYIPTFNICIEVDGEFHYIVSSFTDGEKVLQETQKRDNIKTQYCLDNNIKLIRLPYFEKENFIKILDKELYANTEVTCETKASQVP